MERVISIMGSLLTSGQKEALVSDFQKLKDTFVRDIEVFHEAERVVIRSNPGFNRLNRLNQNATNPQNTPVSRVISARVYYADMQKYPIVSNTNDSQTKVRIMQGMVRIKVDEDGYNFIGKAKKVELDGSLFDIDTVERISGLFGAETYTYWLKRSQ